MIPTKMNKAIPEWLKSQIYLTCPHCGCIMIDNESLTQRRCGNARCPGHMSMRMDAVAKWFNVKGFGPKTAMEYIRDFKLTSHLQIIPYLFKEKPCLYLWEIGELAMVPGFSKKWREYANGQKSMKEFVESRRCPVELRAQSAYLLYVEQFFTVKVPMDGRVIRIMLSGTINGYKSKDEFVRVYNAKYGSQIQLINVGKRKTGVDYLVREEHSVDHEKTAIALGYGIPIITPQELLEKTEAHLAYINEERKGEENAT